MRTGIVMTARPGVEELAARAEELGFASFWVYDTPMVNGDPFVSLALCAKATDRIKLGIGVTSPALRSAPAAAAAVASLNAIAPGRVVCGVGTGNTARRTLGMLPTKMAELEEFTAAVRDLAAGGENVLPRGRPVPHRPVPARRPVRQHRRPGRVRDRRVRAQGRPDRRAAGRGGHLVRPAVHRGVDRAGGGPPGGGGRPGSPRRPTPT